MNYYKIFGRVIETDLVFRQLDPYVGEEATIFIHKDKIADIIKEKKNGNEKVFYGIEGNISWLENKTCFLLIKDGNTISYELKEGGNEEYLKTYILGFGISFLGMQLDILSFHCSALADEKGALLIAGESGAGKSTTASAFLDAGYRLMADDMAWVQTFENDGSYAYPAFPYQKLCRNVAIEKGYNLDDLIYIDEMKDKFLARYQGEFSLEAEKIKGLIVLGLTDGDEVTVEKIEGLDAFYICASNIFLRHILGPAKYAPNIGKLCLKMASFVPIYYIRRPKTKDTTKEVMDIAMDLASKLG